MMIFQANGVSAVNQRALLGDKVLLFSIVLSALGAIALGFQFVQATLAWTTAIVLMLVAAVTYFSTPGNIASRLILTTCLAGLVILHIQLSRGVVEYHFGVFVTLALTIVYLDWRPIVLGAALFAVHHVLFDRLLAAGFGFYCLSEPDFGRIVLHATYVAIQTVLEVMLVQGLVQAAREGAELQTMVQAVNQPDGLALKNQGIAAPTTPLGQTLQTMLQRMQQALTVIHQSVDQIRNISTEISNGNQDLSTRTVSTAHHLEQTAAKIAEFTTSVQSIDDASNQAKLLAVANAQAAQRGGEVVGQVVSTMGEINQSSQKINDIIGVIDGIAFQTNILALNAAVEAARAGEQGRGFAVVAAEVRSLAQRSAQAAQEIKTLISVSVGKVDSGMRLVQAAGTTINELVVSAERVSAVIENINHAIDDESSGISQINSAIGQLDDATQHNAALAEQSHAAACRLHEQAEQLANAAAVFR